MSILTIDELEAVAAELWLRVCEWEGIDPSNEDYNDFDLENPFLEAWVGAVEDYGRAFFFHHRTRNLTFLQPKTA